jgi:gluconolactonase
VRYSVTVPAEVVATGIPFGEASVWCADGTLVVPSVAAGALYRVRPADGRTEVVARTGGGPNGIAPLSDGGFLVCQNGGFDFAAQGLHIEGIPPYEPVRAGLQRVHVDGRVEYLDDVGWLAPNNAMVRSDGTLFVSDSGPYPPPTEGVGRVLTVDRTGDVRVLVDGLRYPNGIARDPQDGVVVVEQQGVIVITEDGDTQWIIEDIGAHPDGLCVDADGRMYVAATTSGVRVVEDGRVIDTLAVESGLITSCCFGGSDGRTLFATNALAATVVAWESMPCRGLEVLAWQPPG